MERNKKYENARKRILTKLPDIVNEYDKDKLTLCKLVSLTGISKNTFYSHYQNMDELYDDYCSMIESEADIKIEKEGILKLIVDSLNNVKNSKYFQCYIILQKNFPKRIAEQASVIYPVDEDSPKMVFLVCGLIGLVKNWMHNGFRESPEEVGKLILEMGEKILA